MIWLALFLAVGAGGALIVLIFTRFPRLRFYDYSPLLPPFGIPALAFWGAVILLTLAIIGVIAIVNRS